MGQELLHYPIRGTNHRESGPILCRVVLGAGGAVDSVKGNGVTVEKTAAKTGRYTVTLDRTYPEFFGCDISIEGSDDAAIADDTAVTGLVRHVHVDTTGVFYVQFIRDDEDGGTTKHVDAELADSSVFNLHIWVSRV